MYYLSVCQHDALFLSMFSNLGLWPHIRKGFMCGEVFAACVEGGSLEINFALKFHQVSQGCYKLGIAHYFNLLDCVLWNHTSRKSVNSSVTLVISNS